MSIKLKNVTVDYGSMYAVNNLSLEIETGKLACLLGPSGCGKTTTLFAMAGLLNVSQGQIFFHDKDVTKTPPKDRKIGLVFQNYALYPHLDVMDNIAFPLHQNKKIKIDIKNHNMLIKHKIQNLKSSGLNITKSNFQNKLLTLLTEFFDTTYNQLDNQAREVNNVIWELQKKEINLIYKNPNLDLLKNVMLSKWRYKVLLFIYSQKLEALEKLWKNVYAQVLDFYYDRLKEIAKLDSLDKKQKKNDFKHTYNVFYSLLNQVYTEKTKIIHSK
ncbi:MAG: ABC transporter ATP-binding protein, partial [Mycoplasma sp.]|nr:ABC transporter ATP-binding protein [Mycoplasma sp.]